MDQGVIQAIKANYRKRTFRKLLKVSYGEFLQDILKVFNYFLSPEMPLFAFFGEANLTRYLITYLASLLSEFRSARYLFQWLG